MIVLDASAALELLFNSEKGRRVANRIASPQMTLHVPEVIDLEICQALRRYVRLGGLETERARATLELFGQLDLTRYSHEPLLSRVWELRRNFTAYDAAYVALSEALGAPLLTADQRLARGMVGTATIELA